MMGTAVGTEVFVKYGWRPGAALSVAWSGFTLLLMLARGPHCKRHTWFGYEGGIDWRKIAHLAAPSTIGDIDSEKGDVDVKDEGIEGGPV